RKIAHGVPKYEGLDVLFEHFREHHYDVALLSTGLRLLTSYFTGRYSIAECRVNDLETREGICTGRAVISVAEGDKGRHAREIVDSYRPSYVIAIGDSISDIPMLTLADLSISVNATNADVLAAVSQQHVGDDLSALCEFL
ncbi:MAG: HAD family hydrolase, partial [Dermatophilaceae bacterium]